MGSILQIYDYGSRVTKDVDFIQCVGGHDPQLHKMCCQGLEIITREIHPTARVGFGAGTVGQFTTKIAQLSINGSVQLLVIPDFVRNSGFSFNENLQAPTVSTDWVHANTSNQNWVVSPGGPYIM